MWIRLILAVALIVAAGAQVFTQTSPAVRGITGSWEAYPVRGDGFGSGVPAKTAVPGPAPIPEPPLKQPYLDEWRALRARDAELTKKGLPPPSTGMACMAEGMPGMMQAMFPMEILETPGQVTIIQEAFTQVRRVYLDAPPIAPDDAEPRFAGHSTGRWTGSTLVAETVGVKESARFRNVPHSTKMRITERIRLVTPDVLHDQITIEDPVVLEKPFTYTLAFRRLADYKMVEFVCENNREYIDEQGRVRMKTGGGQK